MDSKVIDYDDNDVSPASIIPKALITWDTELKANNATIDGNLATFTSGGFNYVRSVETFESGRHTFNILLKRMSQSGLEYATIGVSWDSNLNLNCGCYYFNNSHLYCNYYPTITDGNSQLFNTPPKFKEGDIIGVTIDFDNRMIEFLVNDTAVFSTTMNNNNQPVCIVGGMFCGTLEIV